MADLVETVGARLVLLGQREYVAGMAEARASMEGMATGAKTVAVSSDAMRSATVANQAAQKELATAMQAAVRAQGEYNAALVAGKQAEAEAAAAGETYTAEKRAEAAAATAAAAAIRDAALLEMKSAEESAAAASTAASSVEAAEARKAAAADASGKALKTAALGVGVVAAVVAVAAVNMAADFQAATERLVTSAGESQSNLDMIRQGILGLAGQVGYSADQLSTAMYKIESGGQHGAAGLDVLKAAAQGAKTENADLTTVSDALTSVLTDYHLKASDSADVTSKLVAATSAGKMTFEELAGSMSAVLPVASANHVSLNDILGDLASLTVHGQSAQQSAQNLTDVINHMASPTQAQSKELAILGINAQQLSSDLGTKGLSGTLQEVAGAIQKNMGGDAQKVILDLSTALKGLPPQVQDLGMKVLDGSMSMKEFTAATKGLSVEQAGQVKSFAALANSTHVIGSEQISGQKVMQSYSGALAKATGDATGLRTTLMLTGENSQTTASAIDAVSKATADAGGNVKGWDEIQSTFNVKLAQAKDGLGALAISIGTYLLPPLTVLVGALATAAQWMSQHQTVALVLAGVLGVALVAGLIMLTAAFYGWAVSILVVDGALSPVILVVGAIVLAIAALAVAAYLIINNWGAISGFFVGLWNTVWNFTVSIWTAIAGFFVSVFNNVLGFFRTVWGAIVSFLVGTWQGVVAVASTVWGAIAGFFTGIWNGILGVIRTVWGAISSFFSTIWNFIAGVATTVWNAVTGYFQRLFEAHRALIMGVWNAISSFFSAIWNAIAGVATTIWNKISSFFVGAWNALVGIWNAVWGAVSAYFTAQWNGIVGIATTIWGKISAFFVGAWNVLSGIWNAIWGAISAYFSYEWNGIVAIATAIWARISTFFVGAWNILSGIWNTVWNAVSTYFSDKWNGIVGIATTVWGVISGFFKGAWQVLSDLWNTIWDGVSAKFTAIWDGIKGAASTVWDAVKKIFTDGVNGAIGVINFLIGDQSGNNGLNAALHFFLIPLIPDIPLMEVGGVLTGVASPGVQMLAGGGSIGGGFTTNGPTAIVGEGNPAYPEYVIPTDPSHRANALALFADLGGHMMLASGGILGGPPLVPGGNGAATPSSGFDPLGWINGLISSATNALGNSFIGQIATKAIVEIPSKIMEKITAAIAAAAAALAKLVGIGGSPGAVGSAPAAAGGNVGLVQSMAAAMGWTGAQWDDLYAVIMRESGFNNNAQNPHSTAYGIFQFLDGTWANYGATKTSDPAGQTAAGLRYIAQRYGNPAGALAHEQQYGWYESGGVVGMPPGRATGGPVTAGLPYLVGELGAELFVPSVSGSIMSAADTAAMRTEAGGSSSSTTFGSTSVNVAAGAFVFHQVVDPKACYEATKQGIADAVARR